jgi:acetolactate synthase-1/2/3 large subunit
LFAASRDEHGMTRGESGHCADGARDVEVDVRDVGEAIVAALTHGGIDHLFFSSGTELAFYQEAIAKARALGRPAPRLITMTHEYVGLNAALGYAAVSGKPAVTSAHVDVGTQHHGAALHTAWRSGLPVLMTAGAPATSAPGTMRGSRDSPHFWVQQTFDQNGIVRQFTKWDHRLEAQDNPGLIVSRALQVAQTEPCGPVYLSLPREIVYAPLGRTRFSTTAQLGIPRPPAPDAGAIEEIAERLMRAREPVIVAGCGRNPAEVPALVELCELMGMPVVQCAWHAYQSFPMNHPLFAGKRSVADADVVLAIEADVPWLPGPNAPSPQAFVAVIGVDPVKHRIPTYEFTADLRVTSDALAAIGALTAALRRRGSPSDTGIAARARRWGEAAAARIARIDQEARALGDTPMIDPRFVSYQIAQLLDDNSLVIDDTTQDRLFPYLRVARPGSYFHNPGSAGGWAPGAALGAKLAAPERDVIAVTGDGFYLYGTPTAALWAAVRHGAPFLTVVYQNRSYTTGTVAVANAYPDGYAAKMDFDGGYLEPAMDFAKEAESVGAHGETIRDPREVGPALRRGLAHTRTGRPAVIAVWLPRLLRQD